MWWKLLAGAVVIALAGLFLWRFGDAKYNAGELAERVRWKDVTIQHQKEVEKLELANAASKVAAVENYADRLAGIQPIVVRSKETVTHYAETPAGRIMCLAPERLLGIEQDRTALFPGYSFAAPASVGAVPANTHPGQ